MTYIETKNSIPGIQGLMTFRPEWGQCLTQLAQTFLVQPSPLSRSERELIATYVSSLNQCRFCTLSHRAAAEELFVTEGLDRQIVAQVLENPEQAPISEKLRGLLGVAAQVQKGGRGATGPVIEEVKKLGATDVEIHDTVLIAAAFCMFNRYVDGLNALTPDDKSVYQAIGERLSQKGYGLQS